MTEEAARLAANLARNCRFAVFPCRPDKRPATPHGYKDAASDPEAIAGLWRRFPGPLIGIATGQASGVGAVDIDLKHDAALAWYQANHPRLPVTRTYRTRSGGLHLYLTHAPGIGCSAGKLAAGVDVRGDGGYVIGWGAAGFDCLDHAPPAPWPAWLLAELLPKPKPDPPPRPSRSIHRGRAGSAIEGALSLIATAAEGERNAVLHWAACRLGERVRAGQLGEREAQALLVAAAIAAGLPEREARPTVNSGLRKAS